ncbi:MAG: hypothetical protein AB1898_22730 [Acidobacteriota bacterium]
MQKYLVGALLYLGVGAAVPVLAAPVEGLVLPGKAIEAKLKQHLNKRVLVFRDKPLHGQDVRLAGFNERKDESEGASLKAILFTDLHLKKDVLTIRGEAVEPKPGRPRLTFQRQAKRFQLITCRIVLSPTSPLKTMRQALALLTHVFLTKDELHKEFARLKREARPSNHP